MFLKAVIIILFLGNVIALATSLHSLLLHQGKNDKAMNLLLVRVSLAALLVAVLIYGVLSGQLGVSAPWHQA